LVGEVVSKPSTYDGITWYEVQSDGEPLWIDQRGLDAHAGVVTTTGTTATGSSPMETVSSTAADTAESTPEVTTTTEEADTRFAPGDVLKVDSETEAYQNGGESSVDPGLTGSVSAGPETYKGEAWYKVNDQ
jgi:hypothetical protein